MVKILLQNLRLVLCIKRKRYALRITLQEALYPSLIK